MKEEIKTNHQDPSPAEPVVSENEAEKKKPITDPVEQINKFGRGTLKLETPIKAGDKDVSELKYDFTRLTGWEYADAMDSDAGAGNIFRVTSKQALLLFAKTAGKETEGIDATDIKERIGVTDSIKAVQLATIFFVASTRAGNNRISSGS